MSRSRFSVSLGSICIMLTFALAAFMPGSDAGAQKKPKPIVLKAVTFQSAGTATLGFEMYMNRLNEAAKGELILEWTGGPEAIPAHDQPEAVRRGVVDFAFTPPGYYKSQLPEASATFFSRLYPWEERKKGYYDLLVELHEKAGWRYIGNASWGPMYYTWTNFEAKKPEDLAGHLIRSGRTSLAFCKALGVKPVTMPISDVYSGLDRGILEGFMLGPTPVNDLKLHEVVKYVIRQGFYTNRTGFVMNLDRWNRLPKHLQDVMIQTQIDIDKPLVDAYDALLEKSWQDIQAKGIVFIEFSPEDAERYVALAVEVGWKEAARGMDPKNAAKIENLLFKK